MERQYSGIQPWFMSMARPGKAAIVCRELISDNGGPFMQSRLGLSSSQAPRLYLASASPRRRELLAQIGLSHLLLPQHIDESVRRGEPPGLYVQRLARQKAETGWYDSRRLLDLPVLAADTTVVCDGKVLGKPATMQEARAMLGLLSARTHQVMTAIAVQRGAQLQAMVVTTEVSFRKLAQDEIDAYWDSGEPQDKAGAYGIQGKAALFVDRISGSYSNVVGLPLYETAVLLEHFGITGISMLKGCST
jgi:septum formation protein